MYKNVILDALFIVTFLYYRINFNYNLYSGNVGNGLDQVCNYEFYCRSYLHGAFYFMSFLNIYWTYLLVKKLIKLYKLNYYTNKLFYYYDKLVIKYENIFILLIILQSLNYFQIIFNSNFMKENSELICNQNSICQKSFYSFFYIISFYNIYNTIKVLMKKIK